MEIIKESGQLVRFVEIGKYKGGELFKVEPCCPISGQSHRSFLCPNAQECVRVSLVVWADYPSEAENRIIENAKSGKLRDVYCNNNLPLCRGYAYGEKVPPAVNVSLKESVQVELAS